MDESAIEMVRSETDTFKILVASDNHLGFMDSDPERREDSLNTFEEILQLAQDNKVDFVLLGGDLFHENKPSRYTMNRCVSLLRRYCVGGDRRVQFKVVSDQSVNFPSSYFPWVNFDDPDINIRMPVFTIHGNHDDPTGTGMLSALDILSSGGLVNYFGRYHNLENLEVMPILLQKGATKLAIYGLGSIRDERLHHMFVRNHVQLVRPSINADDWFNVFVVHQNRVVRGSSTNYIPEHLFRQFLDLIIWGHEHDCRTSVEHNPVQGFYVHQPGSSVATTLSEGEDLPKHAFILKVNRKNFQIDPIPLRSVRQFLVDNIPDSILPKYEDGKVDGGRLENMLIEKVNELLNEAKITKSGHPKQPIKPLIRLRVECECETTDLRISRFGQHFIDKVANPRNILMFCKKKSHHGKPKVDVEAADAVFCSQNQNETIQAQRVEVMMKSYFETAESSFKLELLKEKESIDAIIKFVDKDEKVSIREFVDSAINQTTNALKTTLSDMQSGAEIDAYLSSLSIDDVSLKRITELVDLNEDEDENVPKQKRMCRESDSVVETQEKAESVKPTRAKRGAATRGASKGRAKASSAKPVLDDFDADW